MPRPNILDRFRPVGAPGAALPSGAPASDALGPAAELAPVFAALATDVDSCRSLVEDARREADLELSQARERGDATVAEARLARGVEQSRAAARVTQEASQEDAKLLERARRDADELEQVGATGLPVAVRKVIETLLTEPLIQP